MANVQLKTVDGDAYFSTSGAGTNGDPFVPQHAVAGTVDVTGSEVVVSGEVSVSALPTLQAQDAGPAFASNRFVATSADATAGVAVTAAPTSGQYRVVTDLYVSVDLAVEITVTDDAANVYLRAFLPANSGVEQMIPRAKMKLDEVDSALYVTTSDACELRVTTFSYSEA